RNDRIDLEYLVRYTNAHHLVIRDPGAADDGLIARDAEGHALCAARRNDGEGIAIVRANGVDVSPLVVGEYQLPDGRTAIPSFQLIAERFLADEYSPAAVSERCGVTVETIQRLARELAETAFDQAITLDQPWT